MKKLLILSCGMIFSSLLFLGCKQEKKPVPPEVTQLCEALAKNIPATIKAQFNGTSRVALTSWILRGDNVQAIQLIIPIINEVYSYPKPKDEKEMAEREVLLKKNYIEKCIVDTQKAMEKK